MRPCHREEGASLIEVLFAAAILTTSLVSLVRLFAIATHNNILARSATDATVLASQKLEELRTSRWPDPSPATALDLDTPGFVDYIDLAGRLLVGAGRRPTDAVYTRRWSIDRLPADPDSAVVLQVIVTRAPTGTSSAADVKLVTVQARRQ